MIDITKEQLLPVRDVPAYLQQRGLGKRVHVHVAAVCRWILAGLDDVRLESVRIGGTTVTSAEALQQWVAARQQLRDEPRYTVPIAPRITASARRREATHRYLEDHRVTPTELDRFVRGLRAGSGSAREHVAGVLFRAGMRTVTDVRRKTADDLTALPGIGPKSEPVVRALADQLGASR